MLLRSKFFVLVQEKQKNTWKNKAGAKYSVQKITCLYGWKKIETRNEQLMKIVKAAKKK